MALIVTKEDTVERSSEEERNQKLIYSIFWLILLIVLSYPLSWFLVWFWILFLPFECIFAPIRQMNELLEKFITWPRMFGKAFFKSEEEFPNPMKQSSESEAQAELLSPEMSVTMYSILWLLMLIFITLPLAWFLAWFWVLFMPLEAILDPVRQVNELLEKLITWPRMVGKAIWKGEQEFPNPLNQTPSRLHVVEETLEHPETTYTLC